MATGKMITLEIGGQPVMVMVEREQLEDLAAYGYPPERSVYVTTWNDLQIDDTPTSGRRPTRAACSLSTPTRTPGQLDWLDNGCEQAERADITPGRVLNKRPAAGVTGR